MLSHLIRKEILDQITGPRFLILAVLGAVLVWLSLYAGYATHRDRVEEYRLAQKAAEERIRDLDRIQDWNEFFQEGYLVHKPPVPLSLFVRGLDPTLGRSIPLRSRVRDFQWSPASVHPILGVFPRLDLVLVVQLVLSLFVVLLTYDAVCGEKERGTLSLIASHPVPKHRLLLSKLIGALATLLAAFGLPLFVGISVVLLLPFSDLGSGDLNMVRYVEMLINIGYPARYNRIMGTDTAPLIAETESAYRDADATAIEGIQYVRDNLCFPVAEGSFEDDMGA